MDNGIERGQADMDDLRAEAPPNEIEDSMAVVVAKLAALQPFDYEKVREVEAAKIGVRVGILDKEVSIARKSKQEDGGRATLFPTIDLWPEPVRADQLLDEILSTVRQFIICEKETAVTATLWCAFTWLIDSVQVAPLAVITAPEKRCGKSQLLNLIGRLARRPLVAANIGAAAVYRVIEAHNPTLLIDEADSFFKDNEELRGVINSGHTRQSAYVIRCVGDNHEPRQFSTWGAKAISGIGHLSETLMDRAVILELRRKLPGESASRLRHADSELFNRLSSQLARFADDNAAIIARSRPALPEKLNDRAQDNWEPLLAIADLADGHWPKSARDAALKLSGAENEAISLPVELLADIEQIFNKIVGDKISTANLIAALCDDDEAPWATYNRGKPISPRQVAKKLSGYGIASKSVRLGYETAKGFAREQFVDAFARYLCPSPSMEDSHSSVTPAQPNSGKDHSVTDRDSVTVTPPQEETLRPLPTQGCDAVTDTTHVCNGKQVEEEA